MKQLLYYGTLSLVAISFLTCTLFHHSTTRVLTLQPYHNPTETFIYNYTPTTHYSSYDTTPYVALHAWAWTVGGQDVACRSYIRFDLRLLPAIATILSAKLSFYSLSKTEFPASYPAQYGDNECYVRRVTANWDDATIDWNHTPSDTKKHEAFIPKSTQPYQDATDIDVTAIVKDMQQDKNYGFLIGLVKEAPYISCQFEASNHPDPTKRPRLVITYR